MDKSVDGLLKVPFSKRTEEEQLKIILEGKPRPQLTISLYFKGCGSVEAFDPNCYEKETWLTACDKRNSFFCWACLLFASEVKSTWTTEGFSDCRRVYDAISQHKMVTDHINAVLQFQLFVRQNISEMGTLDTCLPCELVRKNRDILRRVLDIVHHIATQMPCPAEDTTVNLDEYLKETCVSALNLCPDYNVDSTAEKTFDLIKNTKFVNDIITTLSNMVKSRLREEMQTCSYLSVILSEHSDVSSNSRLSVVVRYLKDGRVRERFTGFIHNKDKNRSSLRDCVIEVLAQYKIKESKLIAYSCDAAALTTMELEKFVCKSMRTKGLDSCMFVPSHFHRLDIVLEQCISQHARGAKLFKTLTSIRSCLLKNCKMQAAYGEHTKDLRTEIDFSTSNWYFAWTTRQHRKLFVSFFKRLVQDPEEWTDDDIAKAVGFYKVLEEFETIFFLEVLFALFEYFEGLIDILGGSSPEDSFNCNVVERIISNLNAVGLKEFPRLWNLACAEMSQSTPQSGSLPDQISESMAAAGKRQACHELFEVVMVCLSKEIEIRFSSRERLKFVHLLSTGKGKKCEASKGMTACVTEIPYQQLNKELKAVECVIGSKQKSLPEVLNILSSDNLNGMFKHVCNLAEIILTMPFKAYDEQKLHGGADSESAGCDMCFKSMVLKSNSRKFNVINFWSTFTSPITNDWSVICTEQEVFKYLTSQIHFFDEFLCSFHTISSILQLA